MNFQHAEWFSVSGTLLQDLVSSTQKNFHVLCVSGAEKFLRSGSGVQNDFAKSQSKKNFCVEEFLQTTCAESWMTWLCWTSTDKSVMLLTVFYLARVEKSWEGILNRGLGFCVFTIDLFFLQKKMSKKWKTMNPTSLVYSDKIKNPPPI